MGLLVLKNKIGQPHLGHSVGRASSAIVVLLHQLQSGAGQKSRFNMQKLKGRKDLNTLAPTVLWEFYAAEDERRLESSSRTDAT